MEKLKEIKYLIQHLKDTEEEALKLHNNENNSYEITEKKTNALQSLDEFSLILN